eukprot:UN31713
MSQEKYAHECKCNDHIDSENEGGNTCQSHFQGHEWCYVDSKTCMDGRVTDMHDNHEWSFTACETVECDDLWTSTTGHSCIDFRDSGWCNEYGVFTPNETTGMTLEVLESAVDSQGRNALTCSLCGCIPRNVNNDGPAEEESSEQCYRYTKSCAGDDVFV